MAQSLDQNSFLTLSQRFFTNLAQLAYEKIRTIPYTIVGDFTYEKKNTFTYAQKKKIIRYLQSKFLNTIEEVQSSRVPHFTNYDPSIFKRPVKDLADMKNVLLKAQTQVEAAEENFKKLQISEKILKGEYLNEVAFEFDKQRRCSMGWGLVFGALICSTIYRRGSTSRKAALFLTFGHLFGQTSYQMNIDKYIDSVSTIFEQDVKIFEQEEKREEMKVQEERKLKKNIIES